MNTLEKTDQHFLLPGTLFADRNPHVISTILGSCVAVCLFDKYQQVGGINHYILPLWPGDGLETPKYGNVAIHKLLDRLLAIGCRKENIIAKVFGGAQQLQGSLPVGTRNIEIAHHMLNDLKIPIVAENTGGIKGRKILFNSFSGDVYMKFL